MLRHLDAEPVQAWIKSPDDRCLPPQEPAILQSGASLRIIISQVSQPRTYPHSHQGTSVEGVKMGPAGLRKWKTQRFGHEFGKSLTSFGRRRRRG